MPKSVEISILFGILVLCFMWLCVCYYQSGGFDTVRPFVEGLRNMETESNARDKLNRLLDPDPKKAYLPGSPPFPVKSILAGYFPAFFYESGKAAHSSKEYGFTYPFFLISEVKICCASQHTSQHFGFFRIRIQQPVLIAMIILP